jgi:hypothetical protein
MDVVEMTGIRGVVVLCARPRLATDPHRDRSISILSSF